MLRTAIVETRPTQMDTTTTVKAHPVAIERARMSQAAFRAALLASPVRARLGSRKHATSAMVAAKNDAGCVLANHTTIVWAALALDN